MASASTSEAPVKREVGLTDGTTEETRRTARAAVAASSRKPYRAPAVTPLGNIVTLTLGMGGSKIDNGQGQPTKNGIG